MLRSTRQCCELHASYSEHDGPAAVVKCGGVAAVLDALRLLRKTTAATASFSAWNVHSLAAILHRIIHVAVESSPIQSRWIQAVDGCSAQGPPVRPGTTADLVTELMAVYGTGGRFPDSRADKMLQALGAALSAAHVLLRMHGLE